VVNPDGADATSHILATIEIFARVHAVRRHRLESRFARHAQPLAIYIFRGPAPPLLASTNIRSAQYMIEIFLCIASTDAPFVKSHVLWQLS
jgi:hypothetical protein